MTWEPEGGWARTPPAPLLEALNTIEQLERAYGRMASTDDNIGDTARYAAGMAERSYRESARLLKEALREEYAP